MKLDLVTYVGPEIDDQKLLEKLPKDLAKLLSQVNGFIQFHGGLHVRGVCTSPTWHSLRSAWMGENAFHRFYPEVGRDDIPFAEDCLGDQFFLQEGTVWRLFAETGELESLEMTFSKFLASAQANPDEFLGLHYLKQFQSEGGVLEPGQLLTSYPPFCSEQAEDGVKLTAISSEERYRFLADFAAQMRAMPDDDDFDEDE